MATLTQLRLIGLTSEGLDRFGDWLLDPDALRAFLCLQRDAAQVGFDLQIASAHRSFERQLAIWNQKLSGERPVLDDNDCVVSLASMREEDRIDCVLRYSALPGASRHHWGSDIDVFDAAAVPPGYRIQLSQQEVAMDGPFAQLHAWLDERIITRESYGFYRPYDSDRDGVAPERWHLSYAPVAAHFAGRLRPQHLLEAWDLHTNLDPIQGRPSLDRRLDELVERYVHRVAEVPVQIDF
ncbi:MAG: M15 family metallopeptidase [Pseudomonadota bacterium]